MVEAETFITELEAKNQASIDRLAAALVAALDKENLTVADLLRVDLKIVIEAAEVAALWMSDSEDLEVKLAQAQACGDGAGQYRKLYDRLLAMGVDLSTYDPRQGGYSKLFA